jgi:hypothetical protein
MYLSDIKSTLFSADDAAVALTGRVHLYGISFAPKVSRSGSGTESEGLIEFYDLNAAGGKGSDKKFTIAIHLEDAYGSVSRVSLGEEDSYIRFDRGLFIDEVKTVAADPLECWSINLLYALG